MMTYFSVTICTHVWPYSIEPQEKSKNTPFLFSCVWNPKWESLNMKKICLCWWEAVIILDKKPQEVAIFTINVSVLLDWLWKWVSNALILPLFQSIIVSMSLVVMIRFKNKLLYSAKGTALSQINGKEYLIFLNRGKNIKLNYWVEIELRLLVVTFRQLVFNKYSCKYLFMQIRY